jgi:hypothetical protein
MKQILLVIVFIVSTSAFSQVKHRLDSTVTPYEKRVFIYDNYGNEIKRILYLQKNNDWKENQKIEFSYDNKGNPIMKVNFLWNDVNNVWEKRIKEEFAFDDRGSLTIMAD